MNAASEKRLLKVHPTLRDKVIRLMSMLNFTVEVVQGLRTYEEQNTLYSQGRTRKGPKVTNAKGGQSYHNFGLAVDLCPFKDGKPDWNDEKGFDRIGTTAESIGLDWGGRWPRFPDRPHVQLKGIPQLAECRASYAKGGVAAVWEKVK